MLTHVDVNRGALVPTTISVMLCNDCAANGNTIDIWVSPRKTLVEILFRFTLPQPIREHTRNAHGIPVFLKRRFLGDSAHVQGINGRCTCVHRNERISIRRENCTLRNR